MKLKKTSKNCFEPVDKQSFKKPYLQRKIEEDEAEQELVNYRNGRYEETRRNQGLPEMSRPQFLDEEGHV